MEESRAPLLAKRVPLADVVIGDPIYWQGSVAATMQAYEQAMSALAQQ